MNDSSSPSLIVELRLPAYQFVLSRTLAAVSAMIVELERFVPTSPSSMPYLWATGDGRRGFEDAVETEPDVERVTPVDEGGLFRVAWADVNSNLFEWLRTGENGVLQAIGQEDEWYLKLRFEDRGSIGKFQEYRQGHDVDFGSRSTLGTLSPCVAPVAGRTRRRDTPPPSAVGPIAEPPGRGRTTDPGGSREDDASRPWAQSLSR